MSRAGSPAAIVRVALSQRASPRSRAAAPPVPTSTRAASQPRLSSSRPRTAGQVSSSWPQTWSPTAARTAAAASSTSAAAERPALGHGRDPDVHGVGPGVRGDERVRGAEQPLAQQRRHGRLADPCQSVGPGDALLAQAAFVKPRQDPALPHRPHLARRSGQGHDDAAVGPVHPPAGRGASVVGDRRRRGDEPGLLEVRLGEGDARADRRDGAATPPAPGPPRAARRRRRRSPRASGRRAWARGRRW